MITPTQMIGIAGLVILAASWIDETWKIIKAGRSPLDKKFAILYSLGSLCLVVYSFHLGDMLFMVLNGFVFLLSLVDLGYTLKSPKKAKRRKK